MFSTAYKSRSLSVPQRASTGLSWPQHASLALNKPQLAPTGLHRPQQASTCLNGPQMMPFDANCGTAKPYGIYYPLGIEYARMRAP